VSAVPCRGGQAAQPEPERGLVQDHGIPEGYLQELV